MGNCDVCGAKLGIMGRFRCDGGYICKACYRKASRQFTETTTKKTLAEIRKLCQEEDREIRDQEFEIDERIGNYVLLDRKNHKICLLNNRAVSQHAAAPEFYSVEEIKDCRLVSIPNMTEEELDEKVRKKADELIDSLKICIRLQDERKPLEIPLISSRVRIKSYAFRRSYYFARRIEEGITDLL